MFQVPLPENYLGLDTGPVGERIERIRESMGKRLVILGHHYQREEVIRHADFRGDSFGLSRLAAAQKEAAYVVFCGVHFMAESADILTSDRQTVVLPDLNAGCSMADMAQIEQVIECWETLTAVVGDSITPVTYMNSAADLKDFVGRRGGAVCTSSNALAVMRWALDRSERVLFFPDQHLGRNTAVRLGMGPGDPVVWDPRLPMGGNDPERLLGSRVILWKGHCSVHQRFTVRQVENLRRTIPDVKILVHPECAYEVVSISDHVGSTEQIVQTVRNAPAGSRWAIGTEINLVHRIAKENPDKVVVTLDPVVCVCATMYRIDPAHLLWALENLSEGHPVNVIRVPPEIAEGARLALHRMLEIR